jgi:parallel beta-helix repeat protein
MEFMRKIIFILTILTLSLQAQAALFVDDIPASKEGDGSRETPFHDLQYAIDHAVDHDTIFILPGRYGAEAYAYPESLCGNCQEHKTKVKASRGFLIKNKSLTIIGSGPDSTILVTNAGYGVLFENSHEAEIYNLTITGGIRDFDGAATDAGIVARWSKVTISGCVISDNTNRPDSIVVGIGGIMGREGSELSIRGNRIINNSWDGIALYRGATAIITDNIINGGRGAGIGVTWDACATVVGNKISNYWKGIGSFGDSRVICSNNAVFDNLGWGIIATGTTYMDATNNVVFHNGNCGMAIWSDECRGRFSNNIVMQNGWRDQWVCPCVGIWNAGSLYNFEISYNNVWGNKAGEYGDMPDYSDRNYNLKIDPEFADSLKFILSPGSPLIDNGNPLITDPDGTVSDIGIGGGPRARRQAGVSDKGRR